MAILDISKIKSAEELEKRARLDLEGKTLAEISDWIRNSDSVTRVSSKAGVGHLIEEGYFGIGKNNVAGADIEHLQVEIKTSPLTMGADGKLRVKEPLSLNIINYQKEHLSNGIEESSLYKKNRRILFIWYIHDRSKLRSEYVVRYVFLWEMDDAVLAELAPDYRAILDSIRSGNAHGIHQHQHDALTLCPKHGGKFKDPDCRKSKTTQPFSDSPAEIRAFRLKNSYMNSVIRNYLARDRPSELKDFVAPKKRLRSSKKTRSPKD